jgi:16S rRNA (cytosine967-C5)-methyltransferase
MRLHDISSQSIIPLLALEPGLRYLDLCAAPGNKTLQALETPLLLAVACDISPARIRDVPPVCPRVVLDASEPLPFGILFDRIFIDAPCSGTGTLSRNPEIKWRLRERDLPRFADKQLQIARQAARLLAPAGKLVYATCSLEREENEDIVRILLEEEPSLRREREVWRIPGRDEGDGFFAAVLTRSF